MNQLSLASAIMKAIIGYTRDYFREEWNAKYFGIVGVFLAACFVLNYGFGFETETLRHLPHPLAQAAFYCVFYALPFLFTLGVYAVVTGRGRFFREKRFWVTFAVAFSVLPVYIASHNLSWYLVNNYPSLFVAVPAEFIAYVVRYLNNLLPGLFIFLPVYAFWRKHDRGAFPLYGFSAANIKLPTYFIILLLLVPVVVAASFGADFQSTYPRFKFGLPAHLHDVGKLGAIGLFEVCYGVDFVFVEFLFRGFMVMAFSRVLGSASILPMVVVYALIHFQKPLGEALGSIAGGLILGIIAYRTRSIYGGVILHLGVAYLMEIAGTLQMVLRQAD